MYKVIRKLFNWVKVVENNKRKYNLINENWELLSKI